MVYDVCLGNTKVEEGGSKGIYAFEKKSKHTQAKIKNVHSIGKDDDELKRFGGFVMMGMIGTMLTVVFKGTSDMDDAKADITSGTTVAKKWGDREFNCGEGFLRQYKGYMKGGLKESVKEYVEQYSPTSILVAGHSLGGATASCFAIEYLMTMREEMKLPFYMYTFGAPRVLAESDADFVHGKIDALGDFYVARYVAYGDGIPSTPTSSMGFKHFGKAIFLNARYKDLCMHKFLEAKHVHQDYDSPSCCALSEVGFAHLLSNYIERTSAFLLPEFDATQKEELLIQQHEYFFEKY